MSDTALHQLAASTSRWIVSGLPEPDDPSWAQTWASATEQGKGILARAWLWTAARQLQSIPGSSLQWEFLKFTFQRLAWVRQVRPYLDTAFWDACPERIKRELRQYLDPADTVANEKNTDLRTLLFGERSSQVQALKHLLGESYAYGSSTDFWRFLFELSLQLTKTEPTLLPELAFAAYTAGYYNVDLPQQASPDACAWYYLGVHEKQMQQSFRQKQDPSQATATRNIPSKGALKRQVQKMPSAVVAQFLLYYVPEHLAEDKPSGEQYSCASFLLNDATDTRAMPLLFAEWMPSSAGVWMAAHTLGLPLFDVCVQLANGDQPMPACTLPSNLTVATDSPL